MAKTATKSLKMPLTGNDAGAYAMKQINPDVVAAYPITPQTELMQNFAQYVADGDVDGVVLNSRQAPTLIRNDTENPNHWLEICVLGITTNREGVGARVTLEIGNSSRTTEVHSGRGYQSHYGSRLHFGLGQWDRIDRIKIDWIGGDTSVFEGILADQVILLRQGDTEIVPAKWIGVD